MKNSRIGRNDPCPCGSGKKYKHCCLGLEGIVKGDENPFVRYSQLISTIKLKLDQQYSTQIKKMRKTLQDRFLRLSVAHFLPEEQESFFSDWLWFDMTDGEGDTFSNQYLRENEEFMEAALRDCLHGFSTSYLSFYEPIGMEGDCLRVKDFLSGQEDLVLLKEPLDTEITGNLPLLMGRLVSLPLGKVFSGMVLMLKNDDGQGEFIRKYANYLREVKGEEDLAVLLKEHGEVIFGLFDHANHKALLPVNDIRKLQSGQNIPSLIAALNSSEACSLVHETEEMAWYDLSNSISNARIGVHPEYVLAYAVLLDDMQDIESLLKEFVPQDTWDIVHSVFLFQAPAPHLEKIWYTAIKEQETERWLHTTHRELNDKTPLEILQEENGQERLLVMLDSFASLASANEYSVDLVNYMRLRII
jgi:hypothetical protein